MSWTLTDDPGAFRDAAYDLLSGEPVRHTVLLSVLSGLTRFGTSAYGADPPVLGWWAPDGTARAAVLQTPPWPLVMTALPGGSAAELARALAGRGTVLPGVNGPEADASALAAAWLDVTGAASRVRQRQRLYRLGALVPPDPAPSGAARAGTAADAAVAASWFAAFAAETGQADAAAEMVADRLERGLLTLWECAGEPVSLAGMTDVLAGVARVGPVYTPPGLRGRGYGSAVTAAVTRAALARAAAAVILFTDLANPVSNSIYGKLGYEPVEDRVVLDFLA